MGIKVQITDNSDDTLMHLAMSCMRALERCGSQAEGYAQDLCPVDTGNLRNSITHQLDDHDVFIGTDVGYAPYVELGTGKYAEGGGGRPTPWVYMDEWGLYHWTAGNPAQPFLKPAVADHAQTYKNIMEDELKNG